MPAPRRGPAGDGGVPAVTVRMSEGNERLFRDLERELEAAGRTAKTRSAYHQAMLDLEKHLRGHSGRCRKAYPQCCAERPAPDLAAVTRDDIRGWLIARRRTHAKDSVASYFRSMRRVCNWMAAEGLVPGSPMTGMTVPAGSDKPVDVPDIADIRKMLGTCRNRDFIDLRDEAIIRLACETGGPRASELCDLDTGDLDLQADLIRIREGKGGRWRMFALSQLTARALSRYLRARDRHPKAPRSQALFLGVSEHNTGGRMTASGVYQVFKRRCDRAGVRRIHPHQCRHLGAHLAKKAGMSDDDLMRLYGWRSRTMLGRYGAGLADQRAVEASRALALGNQL